jgi:hypothetical protein
MPMGELLRPRSFRQTRVIAAVHPFFVNQQPPCKARFLRKCPSSCSARFSNALWHHAFWSKARGWSRICVTILLLFQSATARATRTKHAVALLLPRARHFRARYVGFEAFRLGYTGAGRLRQERRTPSAQAEEPISLRYRAREESADKRT